MTGSDLDTELRRAAEEAAESIREGAQAEAEQLASAAAHSIEDRRQALLEDRKAEYDAEARRAIAAERQAAMRTVLVARARVVDRVLERAKGLLPEAAKTDQYELSLGAELADALQFVDGDGATVRCSAGLEPSIKRALSARPEIRVEVEANAGTGFIVASVGDSVVVDGRLETRIDRLAAALAIEIHTRLREA